MSEETEIVAGVEVEQTIEPAAVAVEETPHGTSAETTDDPPVQADQPVSEAPGAAAEAPADEPELEAVVRGVPLAQTAPGRREAQLYLCERGHRTLILWGDPPATCNARKTRNEVCGLTLYHSTELPEQIQKALNPIKASKKKSGKK
jgi:hypothetical protein